MKKARIMIAAIGLFAIVAGAVAVQAKSTYGARLWFTTIYSDPATVSTAAIPVASGSNPKVYTTAIQGANATSYVFTAAAAF